MDKAKEQSLTKEQKTRLLKALLKKADQNLRIRDQQKKKARMETNFPSYQEQKENIKQAKINRLSKLIQEERAKLPKGAWPSPELNELEYELQAVYNTVD